MTEIEALAFLRRYGSLGYPTKPVQKTIQKASDVLNAVADEVLKRETELWQKENSEQTGL